MSSHGYSGLITGNRADIAVALLVGVLAASMFLFVASPVKAANYNVAISDQTPTLFTPQLQTINVGDTVTWTCNDGAHTTTSNGGQSESWASPTLNEGATFSHTFTTTGNFSYVSIASGDSGEVGYIVVQQPTPEFPGYFLFIAVAAAAAIALIVERRLSA